MSSTNRGGERRANDSYMTPPRAVRALLYNIQVQGKVLEPCRGSGNIAAELLRVPGVTRVEWCEKYDPAEPRDFFDDDLISQWTGEIGRFDWIVTNPPYSLLCEFIDRSLACAVNVAMLLRVNCLESEARREWWQSCLPSAIYVLAKRPHFLDRDGKRVLGKSGRPGSDSCAYGWFVWSRHYHGIHVIGEADAGRAPAEESDARPGA